MSERDRIIRELQARAKSARKAVFGYCSDKAGCAQATREVPGDWDRICVEGDRYWTLIPESTEVARNVPGR